MMLKVGTIFAFGESTMKKMLTVLMLGACCSALSGQETQPIAPPKVIEERVTILERKVDQGLGSLNARLENIERILQSLPQKTEQPKTEQPKAKKVKDADGNIWTQNPDGSVTWCEDCNGKPQGSAVFASAKAQVVAPVAPLTYAEAYEKSFKNGKPLIVWVGGNFCPQCVRDTETAFNHTFVSTYPGVTEKQAIVVGVMDTNNKLIQAGVVTWWIEGDKEFGHVASIREEIRKWRRKVEAAQQNTPTTPLSIVPFPMEELQVPIQQVRFQRSFCST